MTPLRRVRTSGPPPRAQRAPGGARTALLLLATLGLTACLRAAPEGQPEATRAGFSAATMAGAQAPHASEASSQVIGALRARRSVLVPGSPFDKVAQSVLAASTGSAAAELRVARLSAEAKDKNWLPHIGPSVSLSSLGSLVTSILLEQVIFDNGRNKAERAHAAADVEVAAVRYVAEMNETAYKGLSRYIAAQKAEAQAAVADRAVTHMAEYDRIMRERVIGGVSDLSEQYILQQKLSEIQSVAATDRDAARQAQADLGAMSDGTLGALSGLGQLSVAEGEPLTVSLAQAERARTMAEADMARAGLLPSLRGQANSDGKAGLTLGGANFGFGASAQSEAIAAARANADQKVAAAQEEARRKLVGLENRLATLRAQEARDAALLAGTEKSLATYVEQYRYGRRTLIELVSFYETFARLERQQAGYRFDIAQLELDMARERGLLAEGGRL